MFGNIVQILSDCATIRHTKNSYTFVLKGVVPLLFPFKYCSTLCIFLSKHPPECRECPRVVAWESTVFIGSKSLSLQSMCMHRFQHWAMTMRTMTQIHFQRVNLENVVLTMGHAVPERLQCKGATVTVELELLISPVSQVIWSTHTLFNCCMVKQLTVWDFAVYAFARGKTC